MNRALTGERKYEDHLVPLRQARYNLLQQQASAIPALGADYFDILAPSCHPDQYVETECRKAEWVEFYNTAFLAIALGVVTSFNDLPDVTTCDDLATTVYAG